MKTLTVLLLILLSACASNRQNTQNPQAAYEEERPMTAFERAMLAQQLGQGHQMMIWEPHYIPPIPNNNYNHTITIVP